MNKPEVGPFFIIDDKLYSDGIPINELESYNGFINSDLSHIEYFYELRELFLEIRKLKNDYGLYPRGRVLWNENQNEAWVYIDNSYINNEKIKEDIIADFNLRNFNYRFKIDLDHYNLDQEYYKKEFEK